MLLLLQLDHLELWLLLSLLLQLKKLLLFLLQLNQFELWLLFLLLLLLL